MPKADTLGITTSTQQSVLGDCIMAIDTISKIDDKSYEIAFESITLTPSMRKDLFEFFNSSVCLAQQAEAYAFTDPSSLSALVKKAVNNFNDLKNRVEEFITG